MDKEHPQGAAVLDATERWLRRFVYNASDAHHTITTLWIAGSHMTDETGTPVHRAYPRLGFVSNEPQSGKTTAMERALELTPRGEILVQPSLAGIMDAVEERQTVALDEADKYFGKTGRMSHVVAFLNAGYKQGGGSVRHRSRKVDSFALVMYSGLLEALGVNPDLQPLRTRSMLLEMHPAPRGTKVEEFDDEMHDYPQDMLRQSLSSWGRSVSHVVSGMVVETPESVTNRRAQLWRPLLRVAALAGGDWPEKAIAACAELESGISLAEPVLTAEQRIMGDVLTVANGETVLPTNILLSRLVALPGAPWKFVFPEPTSTGAARELAELMSVHGLFPTDIRYYVDGVGRLPYKGYNLTGHQDCRLCPDDPSLTDQDGVHTDESELHTDERSSVADADNTTAVAFTVQPTTVRRPTAPTGITFSG